MGNTQRNTIFAQNYTKFNLRQKRNERLHQVHHGHYRRPVAIQYHHDRHHHYLYCRHGGQRRHDFPHQEGINPEDQPEHLNAGTGRRDAIRHCSPFGRRRVSHCPGRGHHSPGEGRHEQEHHRRISGRRLPERHTRNGGGTAPRPGPLQGERQVDNSLW